MRMKSRSCRFELNCPPCRQTWTLRTRVGQIADLRDAQGLREGQRTLTARIAEVEECNSAQTLREFVRRIMRLEAQVGGNLGRVLGEARACHVRLDNQNATMDDFHARIRARDHDLSEQESDEEIRQIVARAESQEANGENQPGAENRPFVRRRARNHAPQRVIQRMNPTPPQVLQPHDETIASDAFYSTRNAEIARVLSTMCDSSCSSR